MAPTKVVEVELGLEGEGAGLEGAGLEGGAMTTMFVQQEEQLGGIPNQQDDEAPAGPRTRAGEDGQDMERPSARRGLVLGLGGGEGRQRES